MVQTEYLQRHTFCSGAQRALVKIEVRMISELNGEFLVCLEADPILFMAAKRSVRDRFFIYGRQFMHEIRRWLAATALFTLIAFTSSPAAAGEKDNSEVDAYLLQAEMALQRNDYLMAAQEYRKAAELSENPDVARQATRVGMVYGFDREALMAVKRWYKLDRDSKEAQLYLGQLSFRVGDVRTARRQFSELIENGDEDPGEILVKLAGYLSDESYPEKADKLMRSLARPYSDSALANHAVAMMSLRAGDTEYALERSAKAIELEPDRLQSRLLYARIMLTSGDVDQAIEYTARIIGDDPDPDPDARMELAIMYMMADREDDALSQVNQVLLEQSGRMDALRLMAIINFHKGHLDAAWDDFNDLLASGQYRMDALFYLGRIADFREETDRAIRLFAEVVEGSNAVASQTRSATLLAHKKDDLKGALRQLDEFAEKSPTHAVEVLSAKAQLLASVEKYDEALKFYDKVVSYQPDDEYAALGRSELLLRMGRLDEALDSYADAARRWPKSAMALNAYGYTLADRTDRYREAEKLIRKALRYDPESPAIIDSLGWVLFKLGHYEDALVELERAYEGMQDHEVAAHIVETLVALGRRDEAIDWLVKAEEEKPDSPLLKDVRDRLFADDP
jgi:tetratricopeptide (TPR) repeat protein